MPTINPYMTFNGNCEEAFNFYKSVFGGEFMIIQRYDAAPSDQPMEKSDAQKIMHVSLPIGKGTILMGSDVPEVKGNAVIGTNFAISLSADSKEEADKLFNGLSTGGKVTMPMDNTFWGSYFGMFVDKFSIHWMVSFDSNQY